MKKIISALVIGLSLSVAATDDEMMDPEFLEFFAALYGDPVEEASIKLDEFANKLNITERQEPAWSNFKQFFLDQMQVKQQRAAELREFVRSRNGKPLTTPESLELKMKHMEMQLADAQQAKAVIDDLYGLLNSEQQSLFDRVMRHIWQKNKNNQRHNP